MSALSVIPTSIKLSVTTNNPQQPVKDFSVPPDVFTYIFGFLPLKELAEIALTRKDICVIVQNYLYTRKIELDVETSPWAIYLLKEMARYKARPYEKIREFFATLRVYKNRSKTQIALNQKFVLQPFSKEVDLNAQGVWRNLGHFCDVIAQAINVPPPQGNSLKTSIDFFNQHDTQIAALSELAIEIKDKFYYVSPLIGRCKNLSKLSFSFLMPTSHQDPEWLNMDKTFSFCPQLAHLEKLEEFSCNLTPTNFVPLTTKLQKLELGFQLIAQKELEWIYSLTHLTELTLWGGHRYFPLTADITKFKSLKKLDISTENLPPEIGELTELEELTVRLPDSYTSTLPESLGKLTKLRHLHVSGTNLQLPNSLENLHNLEVLNVYSTQVKKPPAWVFKHEKWSRAYRQAHAATQDPNAGFYYNYGDYRSAWVTYVEDPSPSKPSTLWRLLLAAIGITLIYKIVTYFLRRRG